jgi:hypothetical protein
MAVWSQTRTGSVICVGAPLLSKLQFLVLLLEAPSPTPTTHYAVMLFIDAMMLLLSLHITLNGEW